MDPYLTVEETATRLGISVATVRRRCISGEIDAERKGRSWLIDGTKLRSPKRQKQRSRPATASARADFPTALRHLRSQDLVRDLWVPDILRHEDDLDSENREALFSSAAARLDLDEPFDPVVQVPVPKNSFFVRNAANLSIVDRLAYHSVVLTVVDRIDSLTGANIYSARRSNRKERLLTSGTQPWLRWKSAVKERIGEIDGWMIETDITSFFDCISHTILMTELRDLGLEGPMLDALREMLRTWSTVSNTGLPQGPDASRVLANFYMHPVDEVMSSLPGVSYFRYMDDICIVAEKKHAAVEALKTLDAECRRRNLLLSAKKTQLRHGASALKSLEDSLVDEAKYTFENGEDPKAVRQKLIALFKAALKGDDVNVRRARFSITRLRALREDGVLPRALKRLEELAPLGWLVPSYLLPWLRRGSVQRGIEAYLNDPERNTSDYLSTWLLAALLDEPHAVNSALLGYARGVALDKAQSSYHRAVALNVLALGRLPRDLEAIRKVVQFEYDPEVVRGALVALKRVGQLDRSIMAKAARVPSTAVTVDHLRTKGDLPSLVLRERRVKL